MACVCSQLRLAEERFEEAEARVRQLEKQVIIFFRITKIGCLCYNNQATVFDCDNLSNM